MCFGVNIAWGMHETVIRSVDLSGYVNDEILQGSKCMGVVSNNTLMVLCECDPNDKSCRGNRFLFPKPTRTTFDRTCVI